MTLIEKSPNVNPVVCSFSQKVCWVPPTQEQMLHSMTGRCKDKWAPEPALKEFKHIGKRKCVDRAKFKSRKERVSKERRFGHRRKVLEVGRKKDYFQLRELVEVWRGCRWGGKIWRWWESMGPARTGKVWETVTRREYVFIKLEIRWSEQQEIMLGK